MRRRIATRYTVIVARTGRAPFSVSFKPIWVFLGVALLLGWGGATAYLYQRHLLAQEALARLEALSREARDLTLKLEAERDRNEALSVEAAAMLDRLGALEREINRLRERAGLPEPQPTPDGGQGPGANNQGGGQALPDAEVLLETVRGRMDQLARSLNQEVAPALQETLAREAARPRGLPIRAEHYISSGFGVRRNPFGKGYEFHDGVDFAAWYGVPVYATAPGTVVFAGWSNLFGYHVILDHGYGYRTLYGHLSRIRVKRGQRVERGQRIGDVGSTGRSSGPHLHYSVYLEGKPVDPRDYLDPVQQAER